MKFNKTLMGCALLISGGLASVFGANNFDGKLVQPGIGPSESEQLNAIAGEARQVSARISGNSITAQFDEAVESIAENMRPSVVSVAVEFAASGNESVDGKDQKKSEKRKIQGGGSGFFFLYKNDEIPGDAGRIIIITNNHVVVPPVEANVPESKGKEVTLGLANHHKIKGRVLGGDSQWDIAVIEPESGDEKIVPLEPGDSSKLREGQFAFAMGAPFGLDFTFTHGVIGGLNRDRPEIELAPLAQTDAAINPGNSGGPLVDIEGHVIGVNSMIIVGANKMGFAIPINYVQKLLPRLIAGKMIAKGFLGVQAKAPQYPSQRPSRSEDEDEYENVGIKGVLVYGIYEGGAAEAAGVKKGDVITRINSQPIAGYADLFAIVRRMFVGDTVRITVSRAGQSIELPPVQLREESKKESQTVPEMENQHEPETGQGPETETQEFNFPRKSAPLPPGAPSEPKR